MATPVTRAHDPEFTPVSAVLRSLAAVGEVDLETGLGPRRLAEVTRQAPTPRRSPVRRQAAALALLAAALAALLLALR